MLDQYQMPLFHIYSIFTATTVCMHIFTIVHITNIVWQKGTNKWKTLQLRASFFASVLQYSMFHVSNKHPSSTYYGNCYRATLLMSPRIFFVCIFFFSLVWFEALCYFAVYMLLKYIFSFDILVSSLWSYFSGVISQVYKSCVSYVKMN